MYQVLADLNRTSGVTGSMVVGEDGIIIAADMDTVDTDEAVGALAASITSSVKKSLERLKHNELAQVTIEAEGGNLFLTASGPGILVVKTEEDVNIGLVRLEIRNALNRLES
jgi:predicted regulator of Ras-like GTPase activity (Roadblock/LC7/MglB family)